MNWNKPETKIAFIPWPYWPGRMSKIDLVGYKFDETTPRREIEINDPETNKPYRAEILDYYGEFDIKDIPDILARHSAQNDKINGRQLGWLLSKKQPDFENCYKVLFLQIRVL